MVDPKAQEAREFVDAERLRAKRVAKVLLERYYEGRSAAHKKLEEVLRTAHTPPPQQGLARLTKTICETMAAELEEVRFLDDQLAAILASDSDPNDWPSK